jgi:hypothetical protein
LRLLYPSLGDLRTIMETTKCAPDADMRGDGSTRRQLSRLCDNRRQFAPVPPRDDRV